MVAAIEVLSAREPLRYHPVQARLRKSEARFKVVEAGRRSGKTAHAKRDGVDAATSALLTSPTVRTYRVGFCAPTRDQVKQIYWDDLKALVHPGLVKSISETELCIRLHGSEIWCLGLDKPQRIEGRPWSRLYIDEFADCKQGVWDRHIQPTLDTPGVYGSAWIYGVPRPSSEFKRLADLAKDPEQADFEYFTWPSSDILDPDKIAAARRTMDPLLFAQEYEASRVNLQGLAYYQFSRPSNTCTLGYDRRAPLIFCFDFNNAPGVAVVCQDRAASQIDHDGQLAERVTCVLGEVWIRRDSNTPMVCRELIQKWGGHEGRVYGYGDATGGAKGTSAVHGSDWDLIDQHMRAAFPGVWAKRAGRSNPPVRSRINAVNSRLCSADGTVGIMIDPAKAPRLIEDFESTMVLEGTSGELDKSESMKEYTHMTDAFGYYIESEFPVVGRGAVQGAL